MSINIKTELDRLRRSTGQFEDREARPKDAEKTVQIIAGYFDSKSLSNAQLELAIETLLNKKTGSLLAILKCINHHNKEFTGVSKGLMELYQKLIKEYPQKILPYTSGLIACTTKVVVHCNASARERELAIHIIREMMDMKILSEVQIPELFDQLFSILPGDKPERFSQNLFQMIGLICRNHPDKVPVEKALKFRKEMLTKLENFGIKRNSISFLIAAGSIDGLNSCFVNFPPDPATEGHLILRAYEITKTFCEPDRDISDRSIFRSALNFFKTHVQLFSEYILRDALHWHEVFKDWFKSIKADDKPFVVPAVYAFYNQFAAALLETTADNDRQERIDLLKKFLDHFKYVLLDTQSESKPFQIRLSILSLGILSAPAKALLSAEVVDDLVNIVIASTNYAYFSELADKRDKIEHLPDFIQSLSLLLEQLDGISPAQLNSLENIITALIQDFHFLNGYHHPLVIRSLVQTFHNISKLGGTIIEDLLSKVILQSIIWTCSHKLPLDTFQDEEQDWKQNITFRNYLPLWRGLLAGVEASGFDQKPIRSLIVGSFYKSLILIIKKLDLSTTKRKFIEKDGTETESYYCDPDSDLMPQKASDFQIFFNLVSLCQEVLSTLKPADLQRHLPIWFDLIVKELILKSYEYTLISGFMRLIELFLTLAYRSLLPIDELLSADLKTDLKAYLGVTMSKARSSSGELQLASLKLIFKAPDVIIQEVIGDMVDIFEMGFVIGKSVLWLAETALSCLERNLLKCNQIKEKLLRKILPLFDNFLLSKSDMNSEFGQREPLNAAKPNKRRTKWAMLSKPAGDLTDEDRDLCRVQKKMLLFLGTLEPSQCLYLIDSEANLENLTKWDIERNVKLPIYCYDEGVQPELLLDNLIPRVFHLARAATDRQTKLASCEFIHGVILYVIGTRNLNSRRLWTEICRGMIELACDSDTAVQQMFEPLLIQVMHFKALPAEWNNNNTSNGILLEVIMTCLSDRRDPGLRDMAAKALRELLSWSLELANDKQQMVKTVVRDVANIINFNSMDYNMERRLGAALAFNNIYRLLRENELIVDLYWMMFLYSFSTSLWICDQSDKLAEMDKLVEQVETSLDHVIRVMVERPDIFSIPNEDRLTPESFGNEPTLKEVVDYVFQLSRSSAPRIRRKSQEIFLKLCPKAFQDIASYLKERHDLKALRESFEGKLSPFDMIDWADSNQTVTFLQELLIILEGYKFLLGDCELSQAERALFLKDSLVFRDLIRLLEFIFNRDRDCDMDLQSKHRIDHLIANCLSVAMQTWTIFVKVESIDFKTFLEENKTHLQLLFTVICFEDLPKQLPVNLKITKSHLCNLLKEISSSSNNKTFLGQLLSHLTERINQELHKLEEHVEMTLSRESITSKELSTIHGLLMTKRIVLENAKEFPSILNFVKQLNMDCLKIAKLLFESCKDSVVVTKSIKPAVKDYANNIMEFCLRDNHTPEALEFILIGMTQSDEIKLREGEGKATIGQLFRSVFKYPILEFVLSTAGTEYNIIHMICAKMNQENANDLLLILNEVIEFVFKRYNTHSQVQQFVFEGLVTEWPRLFPLMSAKEDSVMLIYDLVSHLGLIATGELYSVGGRLPGFSEWFLETLKSCNSQSSLDMKSKMINLLPIITGPTQDDQSNLYRLLNEFRSSNLPLKSTEFKGNSLERAKFGVIMKNLLEALRISKSWTIFKFLISTTVAEEKHMMEYEIRSSVTQLIGSLDAKEQIKFLNESLKMALDTSLEPLLRLNLFKRFIKTALRASKEEVLTSFYESQMTAIMELIDSNYSLLGEISNYFAIETALVNRIIGLYLIELLFGSVKVEQMTGMARVLQKPDVKKIVGDLSRKCVESRREIFVMNHDPINELFRKYQCSAYRALCMIVMSTQNELRFFERLLFPASGKDFIWPKIISSKRGLFQADFVSDFEDFPKVKERIVSMKADNADLLESLDSENNKFRTLNNLFSSSLSQDVTKLDFTSRLASTEQVHVRNITIRLEDLAMNNHELMPTLCAVIKHMFVKKITPVPEKLDTYLKTTPDWVKSLAQILTDRDVDSTNIRLFVGRLVENCQDELVNYAPALFSPILQLIVDQGATDGGLNVYYMDLIQMLIKWTNHYKLTSFEEKELASKAIQFMVRNCHNSNFDVMKLNLEIIRIVVTAWKDVIQERPPRQLLNDLIAVNDQSSVASNCALQLNAIFLINDMTPWSVVSQLDYLKTLFAHLDSSSSAVYQTAAQILGYFFALEGDSSDGAKYLSFLNAKLKKIDRRKEEKKFTDILYGIHLQFPAILDHPEIPDPFIKIIVQSIPAAIKTMKIKYLTMLLARAEYFQADIFNEILAIGLLDMLKLREYQLYVLHIINKSLKLFSVEQKDDILSHITPIIKSEMVECRLVAYEILIQLYATATIRRSEIAFTIIRGLKDSEESIQNRLLTFWSEEAQLPFELSDRFHKVVEIFAGVEHMNDFLEFNAQLLLAVLIKNPNSKRQLFPNENQYDNKLMEYEINVSWRSQNLSRSIPLFAKSLNSNFIPGQSTLTFKDTTQQAGNLQFEPTQDIAQIQSLKSGYSIPTQSSFVFNAKGSQILNKNSQAILGESQQVEETTNPLKKRLIRDKEKSAWNVAVQAINKHRFEQQRKLYKRRDKDGKIVLYRRYRYGDFPDFLINNLALLLPLQALVKKDQLVARKVFVGLFQALVDSLEAERKTSYEFCQKMSSSIKQVLSGMKYCNSNVYASFMELAFFNPLAMELPLELTVNISLHNNTAALAALVLENTIIHYDANRHGQVVKRRPGASKTLESTIWMNVAELYKATKDSEIVAGIFADKLESDPELVKALELESNGRFLDAQKIYTKIIHSVQRLERDYCYEAFFNCYLEMGQWDQSIKEIEHQMGDWDQLWTDDWKQENLLPNMIHSQLKGILDGEVQSNSDFFKRLESWLKSDERRNVIKMNFPEELIMFHIVSKNHLAARVLTEENIWSFANEWGHISVLSENVRRERLLDIRIVAEIDKYLELLIQSPREEKLTNILAKIVTRWASFEPRKSDSLLMWDFLFSCRRFFGIEFQGRSPGILKQLQDVNFNSFDKSFKLAVSQRNSQFADKLLSKIVVLGEGSQDAIYEMKCKLARSSQQILKAELRGPQKGFKSAAEALKRLTEGVLNSHLLTLDTEFHVSAVLESVELIQRAYRVFRAAPLTADQKKTIVSLIPGSSGDNLHESVHKYILSSFVDTVQLAEDFPENFKSLQQLNAIRDTNFKLAQYCFDYLERSPEVEVEEKTELQKIIIGSLFDSLRLGSEDGQKLFPSILRFKKEAPLIALFVEKCRQVPVSIFLKWIPQLLSHLNFEKESYLDDLLQRIAVEYPMALYFPFELSYEQFKFQRPSAVDRPLIQRIKESLFDPKMKMLVTGLSSICLPNIMFIAHVTNLLRALKVMGAKDFGDLLKKTIGILFPDVDLMRGRQFRKYSKFKEHFDEMTKFDVSDFDQKELVKSSLEKLKKSFSLITSSASSIDLEDLSPWLANFSSVNGANVEIPGQYTDWSGESSQLKDAVKIMKFGNKISVFGSKTRPVKITIYGSDGRQYNFLLKYSEDLRQDQRIQQILKLMSDNLSLDKLGRSQKLKIVTYNVVPITNYFGMLSWVPDTVPMHEFVRNSLVYNTEENANNFEKIKVEYDKFLRSNSNAVTLWELYSDTVEKTTAGQLRDKFRELSYKLPSDLLRQAIIEISASPESFFMLRNNFCRTMAAMSIAHWILGVGDRHLLNILMNVKTCQLIGIDFNVVFESGFRILPIPELIPFRLTPQFVNVMSPFGVTGVIRSAMIHSLRVFRSEQKLFLTCLEVFLREPTIDWLYNAIHVHDDPAEFNTLSTDTRVHWEPSERLMAVQEKLSGGVNPVGPIAKGLQVGFLNNKPTALEAYTNVLKGNAKENIRARLPENNLTVEQQIDCLIDLATDPAVLGITFFGLYPWL